MSSRKPMYNGDRFGHLTIIDDTPIKKIIDIIIYANVIAKKNA